MFVFMCYPVQKYLLFVKKNEDNLLPIKRAMKWIDMDMVAGRRKHRTGKKDEQKLL